MGIADYLKISPSSATWYLNQLLSRNILIILKRKVKAISIKNKDEIIKVLIAYRKVLLITWWTVLLKHENSSSIIVPTPI